MTTARGRDRGRTTAALVHASHKVPFGVAHALSVNSLAARA
eukprot:CAMPEP_0206564308 /NCGR_PEP_ID=MMETSP0325_2-20121206/23389_1 /ASSEMBLY_ACC=CAM_ASM_000347 /TAXON_ID=2866 /ORGANISM="Crypthecodinium cohnii, Strain Seligo" /LENGTH=40 /DNA_ID= /DNA_START= /DNA_END= /DNA_ORIENTATION=